MRKEAMNWWACPRDGHAPLSLTVAESAEDEVRTGAMRCDRCGGEYEIRDGIPDFLLFEDAETARLKRAELESREQELEWPNAPREVYEAELEARAVLARLKPTPRDSVFDAGCGFGRITRRVLDTGALVVASDFSRARLLSLRAHTRPSDRVELAVADANHLPLQNNKFSKILSTGVTQSLPMPALRRSFHGKLLDALAADGALVVTVCNYGFLRRKGESQEGVFESGIFYHCYDAEELRAELAQRGAEVKEVCGIRHYVRGTYKIMLFPRLGTLGLAMDRALEKIPAASLRYGSLLLGHAVKPADPTGPRPPG